jgi:RNA polymerase sigma factor (TIGR02999 family)
MAVDRDPGTLTDLLHRASAGSRDALDALLPAVYDELKAVAHRKLRLERDGHTLNTTALVHEVYLKLVRQDRVTWQSRAHFLAVAAQAMRRVLIDYARVRAAEPRGGGAPHVALDGVAGQAADLFTEQSAADLLSLDGALEELASFDPRAARVVEGRFFGGLGHKEIAAVLGVSEVTIRRSWTAARAWLRRKLGDDVARRSGQMLTVGGHGGAGGS